MVICPSFNQSSMNDLLILMLLLQTGRISPRTTSRDTASKHSSSPVHTTLQKEIPHVPHLHSSNPNLNPNPNSHSAANSRSSVVGSTAGGAEKRTTAGSQPIHAPSQGYKEGGPSGITKIAEADEPSA
jgi:hypothetical protein